MEMNWINIIGYGCLAPIPLWVFIGILYLMWLDVEYGIPCKRCGQRHYGISCPPPKPKAKQRNYKPFLVLAAMVAIGIIIVFVVQFTPY